MKFTVELQAICSIANRLHAVGKERLDNGAIIYGKYSHSIKETETGAVAGRRALLTIEYTLHADI